MGDTFSIKTPDTLFSISFTKTKGKSFSLNIFMIIFRYPSSYVLYVFETYFKPTKTGSALLHFRRTHCTNCVNLLRMADSKSKY